METSASRSRSDLVAGCAVFTLPSPTSRSPWSALPSIFSEQDQAEDLRPLGDDIADDLAPLGFGVHETGLKPLLWGHGDGPTLRASG
jgi:hypothetical protein